MLAGALICWTRVSLSLVCVVFIWKRRRLGRETDHQLHPRTLFTSEPAIWMQVMFLGAVRVRRRKVLEGLETVSEVFFFLDDETHMPNQL